MSRLITILWLVTVAGCAASEKAAPVGYCYRTLADVVCYETPDAGREARLIGVIEAADDS